MLPNPCSDYPALWTHSFNLSFVSQAAE